MALWRIGVGQERRLGSVGFRVRVGISRHGANSTRVTWCITAPRK